MGEAPKRRVLDDAERRIIQQALADYDKARALDSGVAQQARRLYGELHDARLIIEEAD